MITLSEKIFSWIALPVYVWQGLKIRRSTVRLAPPKQKHRVTFSGKGSPIKVLMLGDSSIAGVGVQDFDACLSGQLPKLLYNKTGRTITQRTCGNNSATAGQLLGNVLPNLEYEHFDFIIINVGVNDSKNFHTGRRFKKEFGGLLYGLNAKFPGATIIWQGLIDMDQIPVLPNPLRKILSIRSRILRQIGDQLCRERFALAPESKWNPVPENWSQDKFHVSEKGYFEWADQLSDYMIDLEII